MADRKPYQLVSREWQSNDTTFKVKGTQIGKELLMIAGPCAVENKEQSRCDEVRRATPRRLGSWFRQLRPWPIAPQYVILPNETLTSSAAIASDPTLGAAVMPY